MTRRVFGASIVGLLIVGGCRAIVGIDDLQPVPPDGGTQQQNPGPDGGGPGNGSSTSSSTGGSGTNEPPPGTCRDAGYQSSLGAPDCRQCCKQTYEGLHTVFEQGAGAACLCAADGGVCASPCACVNGTPAAGQPKPACAMCTDGILAQMDGPCSTQCGTDQSCRSGVTCIQLCGGP